MYGLPILRRRWLLYSAIIVLAWILYAVFPVGFWPKYLIQLVAGSTASFFLLKDTMIAFAPDIPMARAFVMRYCLLSLWLVLMTAFLILPSVIVVNILLAPFSTIDKAIISRLFVSIFVLIWIFFSARFAFVYFAIAPEDKTDVSFAMSWRLTGGENFLATLTFSAVSNASIFLMNSACVHLLSQRASDFVFLCFNVIFSALLFPISLQWMHACERRNYQHIKA